MFISADALEWKTRYESQAALNADLEQQRQALSQQHTAVRSSIREGQQGDGR